MRETYFDFATRGVVNLTRMRWDGMDEPDVWNVCRVNTPPVDRGKGVAARLMEDVLQQADTEGVTLWLWINPSGPMNYSDLADWYNRLGFRRTFLLSHTADFTGTVYIRWPSTILRPRPQRVAVNV